MRSALLLLALVTLTRAWSWSRDNPQGDEPAKEPRKPCICQFNGGPDDEDEEVLNARLQEQELLLESLEKQLHHVEDDFHDIKSRAKSFIREVHADESHLERLEGKKCRKREFNCGHPDRQCISALLACDGHKDCHNGEDESNDLCDSPAGPGSVFEAHLDGNDPCTIRKPTKIRVAVLTSTSRSYFKTVEHVRVALVVTYHKDGATQTDTLHSDGYFSYGKKWLVVNPPDIKDDNRLMLALIFDTGNRNTARGVIFHEASKDVCVKFIAHRVD